MHTKRNKQKKAYEKPAYQTEEILEKMSLTCKLANPNCKTVAGGCSTGAGGAFLLT